MTNKTMIPDLEKNIAALEALLFLHGEPLALKKIATVLALEPDALFAALEGYAAALETEARGIMLFTDMAFAEAKNTKEWGNVKVQLATKPAFTSLTTQFIKDELEEDLSPASLEALSLVLYLGPIPRSRLDYLRGVNSSFILKNLLLRGLIERIPDPERPSVFLYRASLDTLKHLGVAAPQELPEYAKFRTLTDVAENASRPDPGQASEAPAPSIEEGQTA